MHYENGREAKVGDLVRGKGYNFKHEIIGLMVGVTPGTDTCNCKVACVGVRKDWPAANINAGVWFDGKWTCGDAPVLELKASIEYGQCDAFVALDPETGEVLPPIEVAAAPEPQPV